MRREIASFRCVAIRNGYNFIASRAGFFARDIVASLMHSANALPLIIRHARSLRGRNASAELAAPPMFTRIIEITLRVPPHAPNKIPSHDSRRELPPELREGRHGETDRSANEEDRQLVQVSRADRRTTENIE